jgi:diacylglycerol O-acyltransferase / wax synthase
MEQRQREHGFRHRMSDHEAVMWNVEKDPWLNPNGAAVVLLDRPPDMERLRRRLRQAVVRIPRLAERVVPGLGRLSPPAWATDAEFDFDFHLRHLSLPPPGSRRQLYDLATRFYEDPFDRTRPLWQFVVVEGLEDGAAAMLFKLHHAVSDGIGALRMAESFQELERDVEAPDEVDLEAVIAERAAADRRDAAEQGGDFGDDLAGAAAKSVTHLLRRQGGLVRRAAGEVALWPADPGRVLGAAGGTARTARLAAEALTGGERDMGTGSPLWAERSRLRRFEYLRVPLDDLKRVAKDLDGSVNDAFVTGAVEGAVRYHAARDVTLEWLNVSVVVSTRTDRAVGGNAFTPVGLRVPAGEMPIEDRFAAVRDEVRAKRSQVSRGGSLGSLMGLARLLPTSVVNRAARSQAARLDFATSNLRGAPFPVYVSGARVTANIPMGPVAGTAANITALSHEGNFDVGILCDPRAVTDPPGLRADLETAFATLLER